ncbi:yjeF C-terminal region, hydroxyethylthiazole kinase-related/yjeF N-terminal region [Sulfitobacter brevis]|uniref:Bifunctional NAD(P)H-hydrate repair enzyme n=2 Tax=Sulfitobacter brevis TaxID=74348 RepID=A0A1I2EPL9_9RHOB|nr:NAD(P)H-hydrate dehydratase [Sulfitobacter brevis]SFE94673.1 yjeF C-terminal region, hydroxyethylthiazole kinase-related/yjeF N-terminal region [Sulfitobacter brevis]
MCELLTAGQMRSIEGRAIAAGETTGLALMERAGEGMIDAILTARPELAAGRCRAVVLCGPGNNGGDGFVIARLLEAQGWRVQAYFYGDADQLPTDARANFDRFGTARIQAMGFPNISDAGLALLRSEFESDAGLPDVVIDALFGTGLSRLAPELVPLAQVWRLGGAAVLRVAVDVPSGLCTDSGHIWEVEGKAALLPADLTVCFHRRKIGCYLGEGPENCGQIVLADLGLAPTDPPASAARLVEMPAPRSLSKSQGHKYDHGHVLTLSGGSGAGGAARLAARAALRIGAGAVTLGCPAEALTENAAQLNAVMLTVIDDAQALTDSLKDQRRNVICLGPGAGVERAATLLAVLLADYSKRGTVLDADALTALAQDKALFSRLHSNCVLTPHGGEFRRLFPDLTAKMDKMPLKGPAYSKADATREAAQRAGCVVVFKGPDTVIGDPSGGLYLHTATGDRAVPWLATAGAGDVLAGFIAGLMARRMPAIVAAKTATWLHVECARSFGAGLIAEDMPDELPKIFRQLGV